MKKLPITAIVLAGGKGTRMNGEDKGLVILNNKPLFQHIIDKLLPSTKFIMINANRHHDIYAQSGYPVFGDTIGDYQGPLAGIYTGLLNAQTEWVLFVSCDTPFIPDNLSERLWRNKYKSLAAYVHDGERAHPTILLINKKLINRLKTYLNSGDRKLQFFLDKQLAQQKVVAVDFSDLKKHFININTTSELLYWQSKH